jgi:flagellar biosynthesis protein FliO
MPHASLRRWAIGGVGAALVVGLLDPGTGLARRPARADQAPLPPRVAIAAPGTAPPRPFPPRGSAVRRAEGGPEGAGGWWLGTAGIALALALCGGISLATRRCWPQLHTGGLLRVVGRASLSPKHTVHLLSVGGRVLIVGTGPQGAPSLLGELTDPVDLQRLAPQSVEPAAERTVLDRVAATCRRPSGDDR